LEVAGVSELIGGTLDCAFVHVEEVAQSVHALAGLADCGRSAEGAGGVALSALVVDGVGVLSGVAGRRAGRESDLQVGRSGALGAGRSSRAEALEALGGAGLALAGSRVGVVAVGAGAEALVGKEEQVLRTRCRGAVLSDHRAGDADAAAGLTHVGH